MYGLQVFNNQGQILISSEIETLHLGGVASYQGLVLGALNDFPNYANDDGAFTLSGRFVHRYAIATAATPLFFIRPSSYSLFYGILQQFKIGSVWYVDVFQSGSVSNPPTVLAFVTPASAVVSSEQFGLITYLEDGRVAFDSRRFPLSILNAVSVIPPTIPCDGGQPTDQSGFAWNDSTLDHNFKCDNTYNVYANSTVVPVTNMMFSAPSVAQAVYTRQKRGYKRSSGTYSSQDHWSTAVWWVMYQQAYRLQNGTIHAGWGTYAAGFLFSSTWESAGWYNGGGGSGSVQEGNQPYNDKTINLSFNTMIVADATPYL